LKKEPVEKSMCEMHGSINSIMVPYPAGADACEPAAAAAPDDGCGLAFSLEIIRISTTSANPSSVIFSQKKPVRSARFKSSKQVWRGRWPDPANGCGEGDGQTQMGDGRRVIPVNLVGDRKAQKAERSS
jgi:hypothetical protein